MENQEKQRELSIADIKKNFKGWSVLSKPPTFADLFRMHADLFRLQREGKLNLDELEENNEI